MSRNNISRWILFTVLAAASQLQVARASSILIPMETGQSYTAFGLVYWALENQIQTAWALGYRGGSFILPDLQVVRNEAQTRQVRFEQITDAQEGAIEAQAGTDDDKAMIDLAYAPRLAIYGGTEVVGDLLTQAGIPFKLVDDDAILRGELKDFDWLYLHHQYFSAKHDVSMKIKEFTQNGGFLFAMCVAALSLDEGLANGPKGWEEALAFTDDSIARINGSTFDLARVKAKEDPLAAILVQNYTRTVMDFGGETPAFSDHLKKGVKVLGQEGGGTTKYLFNRLGKGFWTYYGGHAPADDAGFRLILDNIFVPSVQQDDRPIIARRRHTQ